MCLPDPRGALSISVPPAAISSAISQIRHLMNKEQEQGQGNRQKKYNNYKPEQRATVGKYAVEHGVKSAKRKFLKGPQWISMKALYVISRVTIFT